MNYCGFNIEPFCSDVCGDHRRPQTLAEICRNMGICCGFRAVAAREKYPGFILLLALHWLLMDSQHKGPVIHSDNFDGFSVVSLKKLLNNQLSSRWNEMPQHSSPTNNNMVSYATAMTHIINLIVLILWYLWLLLLTWFNFNPNMDK